MKKSSIITSAVAIATVLAGCSTTEKTTSNAARTAVVPQSGQYTMVVTGYDWGPGVDKLIINAGNEINSADLDKDDFSVDVNMPTVDWSGYPNLKVVNADGKRTVKAVYTSDAEGSAVSSASSYIALELEVHPADPFSNPFLFNTNMMNEWSNPYTLTITNSKLNINVSDCAGKISPLADQFTMGTHTAEGITLSYAAWKPKKHGNKVPLLIWLHGMGEGGTDPYIDILGNKVTSLITSKIQNCFGKNGAYVLAPQADGFWLQTDEQKDMKAEREGEEAKSYYTEALFSLIDTYVKNNPSIDANRIYIGGCSNGGYMTINMLIEYPDYFAAAWPICEAYRDSKIDDEKLERLAKNHIWFTQAKNDTTVIPKDFGVATVARLNEKYPDADIHFTFWDDVHDTTGLYKGTDGNAYQYLGHWSWLYALNNECVDDGVTLMDWLAKQSK